MTTKLISAAELPKKKVTIDGIGMAYSEMGEGDPILFLHGNPTSSYLWRNVMPHLTQAGRCIAPDLVGMGDSDPLPNSGPDRYRFVEHRHYLDGFIEELGIGDKLVMVVHDWGSALGFDWACRHEDAVRGIAYMEGVVRPVAWDEWPEASRRVFQGFRSSAGEEMILEKNIFVERVLPGSVLRDLRKEEMAVYRRPFAEPGESRRPTLTWPRQIPVGGEPADVCEIVKTYSKWLSGCEIPKLFINADPGAILIGAQREFCRGWKNQTETTVSGVHFIQEDSPHEIGEAVASWFSELS